MKKEPGPEDICIHEYEDYEKYHGAVVSPIFQNTLFVQNKDNAFVEDAYVYTRINNPTLELAEKKLAALENAEKALLFSSGMAAISSGILSVLHQGDHVVCIENAYGPTRDFFEQYLQKYGISVSFVPGIDSEDFQKAMTERTKLFYLESPTTFTFHLQNLANIAKIAKKNNVVTMIDNTWATPLFQNPIQWGIDMVVHSASKYLGGHSDILGGVLAGSKERIQQIQMSERALFGGVMDPHQAWLLIRGLRTFAIRMRQHQESALKVAHFLEEHPSVTRVLYPALKSHPQHQLAQRQMQGFSSLMGIVLNGTSEDVNCFIQNLKIFQLACSWGGFESLVIPIGKGMEEERRVKLGIHQNLVRIHVGLENVDSLIDDLNQALT